MCDTCNIWKLFILYWTWTSILGQETVRVDGKAYILFCQRWKFILLCTEEEGCRIKLFLRIPFGIILVELFPRRIVRVDGMRPGSSIDILKHGKEDKC